MGLDRAEQSPDPRSSGAIGFIRRKSMALVTHESIPEWALRDIVPLPPGANAIPFVLRTLS